MMVVTAVLVSRYGNRKKKPGNNLHEATTGKIASKATTAGNDDLGRWSYITTQGRGGRKITYVTAYQPCDNQRSGPNTWWSQLYRAMLKRGDKDPKPRAALIMKDLESFLQGLRSETGHYIVLGIDANERMLPTSMIDDLRLKCELVDPQDELHGKTESPSYARGSHKIDRVLISSELLPAVKTAGTLGHHDLGIVSDHMGIFVTFDEEKLYRGTIADLLKVENRDVVLVSMVGNLAQFEMGGVSTLGFF